MVWVIVLPRLSCRHCVLWLLKVRVIAHAIVLYSIVHRIYHRHSSETMMHTRSLTIHIGVLVLRQLLIRVSLVHFYDLLIYNFKL